MRDHDRRSCPPVRSTTSRRAPALALPAALLVAAAAPLACVNDPDCGICDPESLVLESIAGPNYAGQLVKLLGPTCVGDACPGEMTEGKYFVDRVVPCLETEDAILAPRGAEEWCRISPLVVGDGLQLIFNNLLDPTSVELVRKDPEAPQMFEVYSWKSRVARLEGPITRYNGDYRRASKASDPDVVTRAVNLACIDNLRDQGVGFDHAALAAGACDGVFTDASGKAWPLRTRLDQEIKAYGGETDVRSRAASCTADQDGVDVCCDACDYELAVHVARYGVAAPVDALAEAGPELRRSPNPGAAAPALTCDPGGDVFAQCRGFIPHVYRGDEVRRFSYDWNGDGVVDPASESFRTPLRDRLREVHPDDRPAGLEQRTVPCESRADCTDSSRADLPGMDCVGVDPEGHACSEGQDCTDRRCVAEWFVDCQPDDDTTGAQGYCVDQRWSGRGTAACFTTTAPYKVCGAGESCEPFAGTAGAGRRFAYADADLDGRISAAEGCRSALGGGADFGACDPLAQPGVVPLDRYDRSRQLPSETRECVCEDDPAPGCEGLVARLCREGGAADAPIVKERVGEYAVKFVRREGGVVYDPALKGVQFLPADLGAVPRSYIEECAALRGTISGWSVKDGWLANQSRSFEAYEDFDRAMCSSSEYRLVLAAPGDDGDALEYIRDKLGNTLRGKSTYVLRTPDFHVLPGSGSPPATGRISACEEFSLSFSNKYDLSRDNLDKLRIVELDGAGAPARVVAGGSQCVTTNAAFAAGEGPPCLTLDIRDHASGTIRLSVDFQSFGAVFEPGRRYRVDVPGLELADGETVAEAIRDPARYAAAFWDACGMPLVTSMPRLDAAGLVSATGERRAPDHRYEFEIDPPRCRDDLDLDGYQGRCDNAPDITNPDQRNTDNDGFGDEVDLCPTLVDAVNTADSDRDGVGNRCDSCPRSLQQYNKNGDGLDYPGYMWIRNIPDFADFDGDGVGDVCDNCIVRSNCGEFGGDDPAKTPARVGDLVPHDDANECQQDKDMHKLVGDACVGDDGEPLQLPGAAGRVGVAPTDDFDQDGLDNFHDECPRQRLPACTTDAECGGGIACVDGRCAAHLDSDNDGVGDACDSCPEQTNPNQFIDGPMQEGDLDGDWIGDECDGNNTCAGSLDPRPIAFYTEVAPSGLCCTQTLLDGEHDAPALLPDEQPLPPDADKYFVPLRADCGGETPDECRTPPKLVLDAPGVGKLPAGCKGPGEPLHLDSPAIAGDADKLYAFACMLPQRDQDLDGIPDACDLCPFVHDPENTKYVDDNLKQWPNHGAYCNGDWDANAIDRLYFECGMDAEPGDSEGSTGDATGGDTTG